MRLGVTLGVALGVALSVALSGCHLIHTTSVYARLALMLLQIHIRWHCAGMSKTRINHTLAGILAVHVETGVVIMIPRNHGMRIVEESCRVHVHLRRICILLSSL